MASHGPASAAVRPPEPRISRPLILHLRGDRGMTNLHRVCGWISQELADRSGGGPPVAYWNGRGFSEAVRPHSRIAIWNGRGCSDSVRAVARGEVDIAMTAPVGFTAAALEGRGVFAGEPFPELRALGVVPQRDRLVVGLRKTLGITSFAQLREDKPALRLATSVHDGVNYVGLAAHEVLKRSGADITGWGGQLTEDERPSESLGHVLEGRADAIIHDGYMLPHWQQFGGEFSFLEIEPAVLDGLWADYSWPSAYVEAGHFSGSPRLHTLDFSDFLVLARSDLPDDVAYAIAWVLGETRDVIESQYRHLPSERSPVTHPLDPVAMGRAPVPLHPGAARYYDALTTN